MSTSLVDLDLMLLYSDNMRAIVIVMNLNGDKTAQIRHIDIHYYIMREALANEILQLRYIQTAEIIMNILTNFLSTKTHNHYMKDMSLTIK
jgi:hypothetical protein